MKSPKPVTMTLRDYSSGLPAPSKRSAPSGSCLIRSRSCSQVYRTWESSDRRYARLFSWIKERGLTAVITGERGEGEFTRHGLEEYVSDCVLLVDNRVEDQISTRRLRVVKYRGSAHGTNEYPFLIDEKGISVLPITAAGLEQPVSDDIVSTGVPGLNAMLGRNGFYRGSSVLLSGVAGAGKTVLSSTFADAACRRGERCLFSTFEESPAQICRNARSIGLNLQQHIDSGLLLFDAARPSLFGMEMHLARMYRDLNQFKPDIVIVDPVSAFRGPRVEVQGTLLRIVDMIKNRGITAIFTSMQDEGSEWTSVNQELASLMDTWIKLTGVEANRERKHLLYVIKARGMGHSNQMREYRITVDGIVLMEPSMGPDGVPADTTRATDASWDHATLPLQRMDIERRQLDMPRRRELMERDIAHMRASVQMEEDDLNRVVLESERHRATVGEQSSASSHRIVVG